MSQTARVVNTLSLGGQSFSKTLNVTGDNALLSSPAGGVPAAKVGTLTTRTTDSNGVITAVAGHGVISTNIVDVYWPGGARFGMTATVAVNAVTVDGGAGDVLPADESAVTFMKPHVEAMAIDQTVVKALAAKAPVAGRIAFRNAAVAEVFAVVFLAADSYVWVDGGGVTNPLTAAIVTVTFSHGNSGSAKELTAAAILN